MGPLQFCVGHFPLQFFVRSNFDYAFIHFYYSTGIIANFIAARNAQRYMLIMQMAVCAGFRICSKAVLLCFDYRCECESEGLQFRR